jgi:hypothetical protein
VGINKNFVVKNGFEVSTDLILANADIRKVGIGTTIPKYDFEVAGGIGATDFYLTGIGTFVDELNVGLGGTVLTVLGVEGSIGIGTALPSYLLDIRSPVLEGQTALYVQGDVEVTGDFLADNIFIDDAEIEDLTITDTLIVAGLSTFNSNVLLDASLNVVGLTTLGSYVTINDSVNIVDDLNVSGITTLATADINAGEIDVTRIETGDLSVSGIATIATISVVGAELSNLNVTGIATIASVDISSNLNVGNNVSLGGTNNIIVGISTIQSSNAHISNLNSSEIQTQNLIVKDKLKINGINTFTSGVTTVTINGSFSGLSTSYELFLPELLGKKGQVIALGENGQLEFSNSIGLFENRIYVSSANGDDSSDGESTPVKTIKRASQLASLRSSNSVVIIVEAGEYLENNPIILYENVAVVGDNLRNTIIRPLNAGKDLFRVRNGCYLANFAMKDSVDESNIPQHTFNYAISFDDPSDSTTSRVGYLTENSKPIITRSPYIQNCSILSFLGANGVLVDGSKVLVPNLALIPEESENPVEGDQPEHGKSIVANAFTMVSFGGIGWRVINDGYSQIVSCFQIFCKYGSLAQSGGYLSITNSATNFGLFALKSTGFNASCYDFDKGIIASTGIIAGRQSLKVLGLGRVEQDLYVLRFINTQNNLDETGLFKPLTISREVDISVGVNTDTNIIQIANHGFINEDKVLYLANENTFPASIIEGLINNKEYYVEYINDNEFKLYEDESLSIITDLTTFTVGINTFQKGNVEFFNEETIRTHNSYQIVSLGSTSDVLSFVPGRSITQNVNDKNAFGYVYEYNDQTNELIISVEEIDGERVNFEITGVNGNGPIEDHSSSSVSIGITNTRNTTEYYTSDFKVNSTDEQSIIANIGNLPENYILQFHRPSIINSSSHTWEFSGSGIDYNALPQNGGKSKPETEQVSSLGGRVYASGTNELGDFKIGTQITAFNRTGNITFNNKVSIAEIDSINLSLSGGVSISEFSTDIGLGDNEPGGPRNSRVSTQLAVRSFLNNRLGNFIDRIVSTNQIPNSILQLNAFGQINPDLVPPRTVNFYTSNVDGGRTTLVDRIPAVNIKQGDTVVEPDGGFVLISDTISEFLILDDNNRNYNFNNGDEVVSAISNGSAIGIVTAPTSVGYGTTGLVKGVLLSLNNLNGGSGYSNPGIYTSIPLVSVTGTGTSALASISINESGVVNNVSVTYGGKGYSNGDILSASSSSIGGIEVGGTTFEVAVNDVETRLYLQLTNNTKFPGTLSLKDYIKDNDSIGISTTLDLNYIVNINPTDISISGDIDFDNDRIVVGINSYSDGDPVIYSSEGFGDVESLITGNTYYIKRIGISSVELYTTYALSNKVPLLTSSFGTHTLTRSGVNTSTNQIVYVDHGFSQGDSVRVTGNTPTGITTNSFYFVGSITQNSFTLHENQLSSFASANGLIINPINLAATGSGQITFTLQNVSYDTTVNTSSSLLDNWNFLSSSTIDAQNIVSGIVSPARLGVGIANNDTFLSGDSSYKKVIKSIGISSTEPISILSSSQQSNGGITTHFGDLRLSLDKVQSTLDTFSTYGIARFKSSSFDISNNGSVSIKNTSNGGDLDAATFGGQVPAFYLDINNITGSLPITRGGTGLSALPSNGHLLVGNGSAYNLTGSPTISGTLTGGISIPANNDISFATGTWSGEKASKIQYYDNDLYLQYTNNLVARNSLGTNRMTLTSGGDATFSGTVTANSDEKLKDNIKTIENALEKTLNLRGVEFDRIETGDHQIGVIAQEVEKIIPEVVYENENGIKSVAYGNLVGLLIEAIKEQQSEINNLKESLELLHKKLD